MCGGERVMKLKFPNLCLLAELIIVISGSNSEVKQLFSLLTRMLSNQRPSTSHAMMKMRLHLKINDDLLSDEEQAALRKSI